MPIAPATRAVPPEPDRECDLCPRLVETRRANQAAEPGWFNGAVPSFGRDDARLVIVGLAPGRNGANATGRPFTGDGAGDVLYPALLATGFATGAYGAHANDGLRLLDCMITNAVRCLPPQNKPTGAEMNACRPFLASRLAHMPRLEIIVALGRIAHDNTLRALNIKLKDAVFAHAATHAVRVADRPVTLIDSYHCSRYNMNTGRLTYDMLEAVLASARARLADLP